MGHRPHRFAAPVWIRAFVAVAALAAVALSVALASVAATVQDDLTELGDQAVPRTAATENFAAALSDMDTQLATVLLAGDDPDLDDVRSTARAEYEEGRDRATAALQEVTAIAGAGADSARLVREVLDEFGRYQAFAAQAMVLADRDGSGDDGLPSRDVVVLRRDATASLKYIVDDVHDLAGVRGFAPPVEDRSGTTVVVLVLGGLLLVALVGLQILLRLRMRRRLNPPVAVATVLAAWLGVAGFLVLGDESGRLGSAESDAAASMRLAWQARSASYDAHADESRYLLDPLRADQYEKAFLEKSQSVLGVPAAGLSEYAERLSDVTNVPARGFLGQLLATLDSPRERDAAQRVLSAYLDYQRSDGSMRELLAAGARAGAVALCAVDTRFTTYIAALDELVDLNQREFDASIADDESALEGWTGPIPYGAGILVVVLVGAGVWPRLNEYR